MSTPATINDLILKVEDRFTAIYKEEKEIAGILVELRDQLKLANTVISDFIMEQDHAPFCPGTHYNRVMNEENTCICMDRNYYNPESNIERAREYQKKYGQDE